MITQEMLDGIRPGTREEQALLGRAYASLGDRMQAFRYFRSSFYYEVEIPAIVSGPSDEDVHLSPTQTRHQAFLPYDSSVNAEVAKYLGQPLSGEDVTRLQELLIQ
jgi:hypothetical protein